MSTRKSTKKSTQPEINEEVKLVPLEEQMKEVLEPEVIDPDAKSANALDV